MVSTSPSAPLLPVSATSPYPLYTLARHEQVTWFPEPVELGTRLDVPGQVVVALGISNMPELQTVEALIIDIADYLGEQPIKLGRLWKYDPNFDLVWNRANLAQLASTYALTIS